MAGIIETWRTQEAGWLTIDDGEAYAWAGEPDVDEDNVKVSRAGFFPAPEVWLKIFDSAFLFDFEWTEEDWKFVMDNLDKFPASYLGTNYNYSNVKVYLAKYAIGVDGSINSPDLTPNVLSEVKEKKKLPPYMISFFKKIKNSPDIMGDAGVKRAIDSIEFMLLMVGKLDDVLDGSVVTKNNGFPGFITTVNKFVDSVLKSGIKIKKRSYWDENSGAFVSSRTQVGDTWWDWLKGWGEVAWLFNPLGALVDVTANQGAGIAEMYEKFTLTDAEALKKSLKKTLGDDFSTLASPLNVGQRIKAKANNTVSSLGIRASSPNDELHYNTKKIQIKRKLVPANISNQEVLTTLREKIGRSSTKEAVSISTGINNTNLFKWSKTKTDVGLFVPSFSGMALFNGSKGQETQEVADFAKEFNFMDDEQEIKNAIRAWYQAGWYAYVSWFTNQNSNNNKRKRYNQIETRQLIAKQIAIGVSKIIAHTFYQYERATIWLEATALLNYEDQEIDEDEINSALENAKKASENSVKNALQGGGLEEDLEITPEELKERQKFVKQCILMYNFESLRDNYRDHIRGKTGSDEIHSKGPFNFRFHALNNSSPDDGANSLITRLQMPPQQMMKPLLDITPDIQAFLVPKIRLFRVNSSNVGLKEIEFVFDKVEDKERIDMLKTAVFDRGNSYGIKSFDFSFEGSNPATARNDITADLTMYFQSFQELIRFRNHGQGEYRIIDLLVFPVNPSNRQGTLTIRPGEYDPSYYRIRADVGWAVPENSPQLSKVLQNRGFEYDGLKNALLATNKSFYLNAVDHDMNLKDDGSVEMKINYRAYAENALKTSKYDVLSSITLRKNREKFKQALGLAIQDNNCNEEELKTLKELFQQAEEELIKSTYKSLMKRLNERNKVFFVDVEENDISSFRKNGFFVRNSPPRLIGVNGGSAVQQGSVIDVSSEQEQASGNINNSKGTLKLLKDGVKDYSPENLKADNRINFFYLGDLIYTAMDSLYEEDGTLRKDIEKTAFLLGSFDTADAFNTQAVKEFNIIDVPVSVQYFYEWFTQNVIKTKRISYPIMDFVRDLTNDLIIKLLFDNCGRRPIDTKMRFNTATFLAVGKGADNNIDSFIEYSPRTSDVVFPVIDVAKHYGEPGGLPFLTDRQGNENINNFYNYVLIYPVKTSSMYGGVGNFYVDGARGVHHFTIGRNKGLIKKISFAKTDMAYIREARYFRNSFDGLQQLSAVYKATIEMFGNTMYYPGMELYIDAVGIGGPEFRSNVKGSLAHILGFGGYHLVTRVNMSISPGKFTTSVQAQWFHSGAKGEKSLGPQRNDNQEQNEQSTNIENKPLETEGGDDEFTTRCSPLVSSLESFVESVKLDPFGENEFSPNLEELSSTTNSTNSSAQTAAVETQDSQPSAQGTQTTSNLDTVPDTGE
jgi:hypothetical protein